MQAEKKHVITARHVKYLLLLPHTLKLVTGTKRGKNLQLLPGAGKATIIIIPIIYIYIYDPSNISTLARLA